MKASRVATIITYANQFFARDALQVTLRQLLTHAAFAKLHSLLTIRVEINPSKRFMAYGQTTVTQAI